MAEYSTSLYERRILKCNMIKSVPSSKDSLQMTAIILDTADIVFIYVVIADYILTQAS